MKVAINGVGIAGPTLAWWLKFYGHEPVLFEKSPHLRTGGYVIDFWGLGYDIAEKMGLLPVLKEKAYILKELTMVNARGEAVVKSNIDSLRKLVNDRLFSIPRGDLASAIYGACHGVKTKFGVHVVGGRNSGDHVRVALSDGTEENFDLLVGADGLHSHVRSFTFGEESQFEKPLGYYVAAFYLKDYPHRNELAAVSHTVPKKQVLRVSLRNNQTVFLFIGCESLFHSRPVNLQQQKETLHSVFGDMAWEVPEILKRMNDLSDIYFDKVSQIRMNSWSQGRVTLIGDAAACASLLAGEGTGLAMTEAYVLAGELHRSNGDVEKALQNYEDKLKPFLLKKQKSALRIAGFFAPQNTVTLKLRDLATRLSNNPFFAKLLVGPSLQDDFELPGYG